MSNSALAACLRHLRGKLAARQHSDNSDEQLLHAFAEQRDQSAFAALVHRHGPMVLHVCRRVLGHEQDAEDAFQATFLVLARRAAMLRKKASLVSFLHGIAYRTALKAKQSAARRRKHEGQAPSRSPANPVEELSWREVRALLDEEIARLPKIYRSVFILCVLEEQSRAEAAQRLGLNENTLSSRLAKARKRLGQRLARRGVELTAVLATSTLATQSVSALPAVLVSSTIQAALSDGTAGLVSAHVAGLAKSVAAPAHSSQIVVCLALAVGAAAVGAGVLVYREPPAPPADPPRAEAPKAAANKPADTVTVRGRVLDPDGKPVKGARLYWPRLPKTNPQTTADMENFEVAERVKADADGRFRFELPRSDIHPEWPISLLAAADGYGVDGIALPKKDPAPEVTLRLVKDHPIEGRVINTEGKPLAGVNVRMMMVAKTRQEKLDDFLVAWKAKDRRGPDKAFGQLSVTMAVPKSLKGAEAVTDKDGRFRLEGAGVERTAMLRLRAAGLAPEVLFIVNRPGFDPAAWNKAARDNVPAAERRPNNPPLLYGPKIEYVTASARRIEGTVREAGSGKPVPGYRIYTHVPNGIDLQAISDKEGKYKLLGVPKMKQYELFALPPGESAWLPGAASGNDVAGLQAIQVDFTVARGIIVRGRILDRTTGKGVRARLRFVPLRGNKYFGKPGYKLNQPFHTTTELRDAGRYQLAVMPGSGVLMIQAQSIDSTANGGGKINPYKQAELDAKDREHLKFPKYDTFVTLFEDGAFVTELGDQHFALSLQNAVKVLDLAPDASPTKGDFFLERGATRTIQIEDADGKPLKGTTVAGVTALWPTTLTIKDATCTIFALDPKKPRRLLFLHVQRHLTGSLQLRGDEKEPVVVRLGRAGSVVGRFVNRDGKALAGADVSLYLFREPGRELYRVAGRQLKARTDKDGRFRIEGIAPEVKFRLGGIVQGPSFFIVEPTLGDKQLKQGETLDVGDVRVKSEPSK